MKVALSTTARTRMSDGLEVPAKKARVDTMVSPFPAPQEEY